MARERIFVPLGGGLADGRSILAAKVIAPAYGATIDAVFFGPDDAAAAMLVGDGLTGLGAGALAALQTQRAEAAERAEAAATAADVAFEAFAGPRIGAAARARLSALVVIDADAGKGMGPLADIFDALVFEERLPVLAPRMSLPARRIAICWDGSREAARALRAAAPLFAGAEAVVLQVDGGLEDRDAAAADPEIARAFAQRCGASAQVRLLEPKGDAGGLLLDAAADERAELLVAGAFGHARLREAVFGGVTRSLLHRGGPSLLLHH